MFPDVGAHPSAAHVPVRPLRVARMQADGTRHRPDVGIVRKAPASVHAVIGFCRELT